MAQVKGIKMLKVVLFIFAVVTFVYGIGYLIMPQRFVSLSGSNPVDLGWLRWPGGIIISLGVGALAVFRNPNKQGIFVLTIALGSLLAGLALLFSWLAHEFSGATWFIALPTILILILSSLLWWSREIAKDILKAG